MKCIEYSSRRREWRVSSFSTLTECYFRITSSVVSDVYFGEGNVTRHVASIIANIHHAPLSSYMVGLYLRGLTDGPLKNCTELDHVN